MRKKMYLYEVKQLQGTCLSFPTDMLRSDRSFPHQSEDAVMLSHACSNPKEFSETWDRGIVLCSDAAPTPARWASFGWQIVGKVEERTV